MMFPNFPPERDAPIRTNAGCARKASTELRLLLMIVSRHCHITEPLPPVWCGRELQRSPGTVMCKAQSSATCNEFDGGVSSCAGFPAHEIAGLVRLPRRARASLQVLYVNDPLLVAAAAYDERALGSRSERVPTTFATALGKPAREISCWPAWKGSGAHHEAGS